MTPLPSNPGLTVALALALGIIFQNIAHHLRVPGIVLLLAAGVVFGPDGFGLIQPDSLGSALSVITGFAVAVILFEGGLNLKFQRLRREKQSIRQLILVGSLVTVGGGTLAARYVLFWPWQMALLFGTLIMVTGPTVINPLLKRLKVNRSVHTVLEAEGILVDAVGAVVATVALEAALSPVHENPGVWLGHILARLGMGSMCGVGAGFLAVGVLRKRRWIPEGSENVFILSLILALFQGANFLLPESGIAAVTMAGIIIGNFSTYALRDLMEFKEELTVLFIGMLFILLAADVRLEQVTALGMPGIITVLAILLVVRPLSVFVGTAFSDLNWKERLFIAWIGPRGIVAAAVASLFAVELSHGGMSGGYELRALVFLVITVTVVSAGLTGGVVAGILGLRRATGTGWVVLSANELARALARLMKEHGQEVVSIDANAQNCRAAEEDCARVIFGNGLQSRNLLRAEVDTRAGVIAVTPNEEINYLFVQKAKEEAKGINLYTVLKPRSSTLTPRMMDQLGVDTAFGRPVDVELWCTRIRRGQVILERWQVDTVASATTAVPENENALNTYLPLLHKRGNVVAPFGAKGRLKSGDVIFVLVSEGDQADAHDTLQQKGWQLGEVFGKEAFSTDMCSL